MLSTQLSPSCLFVVTKQLLPLHLIAKFLNQKSRAVPITIAAFDKKIIYLNLPAYCLVLTTLTFKINEEH
jgi:hypothetical protein